MASSPQKRKEQPYKRTKPVDEEALMLQILAERRKEMLRQQMMDEINGRSVVPFPWT
jgi:hypothetical protein